MGETGKRAGRLRRRDPAARRARLIGAAWSVFAEKGVVRATIHDIVSAAGVAQGTFYLNFASKDEILVAVAESMVDQLLGEGETSGASGSAGASAADRLRQMITGLGRFVDSPAALDLHAVLHHPDNRALHDRLEERVLPRLAPRFRAVIETGVARGEFQVADPELTTWFILGGLRGAELAGTAPEDMPRALATSADLVLRVLGAAP